MTGTRRRMARETRDACKPFQKKFVSTGVYCVAPVAVQQHSSPAIEVPVAA
jgi:hypothetical protein